MRRSKTPAAVVVGGGVAALTALAALPVPTSIKSRSSLGPSKASRLQRRVPIPTAMQAGRPANMPAWLTEEQRVFIAAALVLIR